MSPTDRRARRQSRTLAIASLLAASLGCAAAADPATRFRAMAGPEGLRLTSEANVDFGGLALQFGATAGQNTESTAVSDLHVIASQGLSPLLRLGVEAQISTDAALDGARAAYGLRLLATRPDRSLDLAIGTIDGGAPGALFYTVKVSETLGDRLSLTGRLHRYSTNSEALDYYAIALDGSFDLGRGWQARAGGLYRLSDDLMEEARMLRVGVGFAPEPGLRLTADLVGRGIDGERALGLELGLTIATGNMPFDTDVFGQRLAAYGH